MGIEEVWPSLGPKKPNAEALRTRALEQRAARALRTARFTLREIAFLLGHSERWASYSSRPLPATVDTP